MRRYVVLDEPKICRADWTKEENRYEWHEAPDKGYGWGMMVLDDFVVWDFDYDTLPLRQVIHAAQMEGLLVYATPRGWKIWGRAHPQMPRTTSKRAVLSCGLPAEVYRSDSPRYHVLPVKPGGTENFDWYIPIGNKRVYMTLEAVEEWVNEAPTVSDELFRYLNYAGWGTRGTGAGGGVKIELDGEYVAKGMRHNFLFVVARHFPHEHRETVIRACNEVILGDKLTERELRQEIMAARRGYKTDKLFPHNWESETVWEGMTMGDFYETLKRLGMLPSYPMELSIVAKRRLITYLIKAGWLKINGSTIKLGGKEMELNQRNLIYIAQTINMAIEPYDLIPNISMEDILLAARTCSE